MPDPSIFGNTHQNIQTHQRLQLYSNSKVLKFFSWLAKITYQTNILNYFQI